MKRYDRAVSVGCFVAACAAFVMKAFEAAWWLAIGSRGRAFARSLDGYFQDELNRLTIVLSQDRGPGEQPA